MVRPGADHRRPAGGGGGTHRLPILQKRGTRRSRSRPGRPVAGGLPGSHPASFRPVGFSDGLLALGADPTGPGASARTGTVVRQAFTGRRAEQRRRHPEAGVPDVPGDRRPGHGRPRPARIAGACLSRPPRPVGSPARTGLGAAVFSPLPVSGRRSRSPAGPFPAHGRDRVRAVPPPRRFRWGAPRPQAAAPRPGPLRRAGRASGTPTGRGPGTSGCTAPLPVRPSDADTRPESPASPPPTDGRGAAGRLAVFRSPRSPAPS